MMYENRAAHKREESSNHDPWGRVDFRPEIHSRPTDLNEKMQRYLPLSAVLLLLVPAVVAAQNANPEAPPFVPTPDQIGELMLDMARVGTGDVVYDLGSGDGRLVIAAALRGARSIGVEYDADLVERSVRNAERAGVHDRATFVHGDIFETDPSGADVVLLYLSPEFNRRLRPTLLEKLAPGARIVSHAFHMDDWLPDEERTLGEGPGRATAYLWVVPANVDGFWALAMDGSQVTVELLQRFQSLTGQAWLGGNAVPIVGRVVGSEVEFEIGVAESGRSGLRFRGRLSDGVLVGALVGGAARDSRPASAVRFSHPSRAPS